MAGLGVGNVAGMPMMRPDMHGDAKIMLNTCIHNYFISENQPGLAKAVLDSPLQVYQDKLKREGKPQVNGIDPSADSDSKDDKIRGGSNDSTDNFLLDYWFIFWDMWSASKGRGTNNDQVNAYMTGHNRQRIGAQGMMPNNVMNNINGRFAQGRMPQHDLRQAAMVNQIQGQQGQRRPGVGPMQRDGSGMDLNGEPRPQSPASGGENAPSPKRQRVDGGFNPQQVGGQARNMNGMQLTNGAPGNPQAMAMQQGIDPNNQNRQQYGRQMAQSMHAQLNATNGFTGFNGDSPMMGADAAGFDMGMANHPQRMSASNGANGNGGALADYQMQLMLLEQQNKKRLMMARQEQEVPGNPGQVGPGGFGSPHGRSPHPGDLKRTSPNGQGSPLLDGPMPPNHSSPVPGFDMGQMNPAMGTQFIPPHMNMMGPNVPLRPPVNQQQIDHMRRSQMANGNYGPPMNGQMMAPGAQQNPADMNQQRGAMPPPQAPAAANTKAAQSPTPQAAAPPTPSQKKDNKSKKETKDSKKKAPKAKASATAATPNPDNEKQSTPPPQTPITPVNPEAHIIKGQNNQQNQNQNQVQGSNQTQANQNGLPPQGQVQQGNQPTQANAMQQPVDNGPFGTFGENPDFNMNLDTFGDFGAGLGGQENGNMDDILHAFDFDSFINQPEEAWTGDFNMGDGLGTESNQ